MNQNNQSYKANAQTKQSARTPHRTKISIIEKKNKKTGNVTRIEYAKVKDRLSEFHKAHKAKNTIHTEVNFKDGWALFLAKIIPDAGNPNRYYTGHAVGKITSDEKAFEKLETIAVGRALAFAGFLADGEIASLEEMQSFEEKKESADEAHNRAVKLIDTVMNQHASKILDAIATAQKLDELAKRFKNGTTLTDEQKDALAAIISANKEVLLKEVDAPKTENDKTST